jgi:hypothetical protein
MRDTGRGQDAFAIENVFKTQEKGRGMRAAIEIMVNIITISRHEKDASPDCGSPLRCRPNLFR